MSTLHPETKPVSKMVSKPPILARAFGWIANPRGLNQPAKLHAAVAGKVVLVTGASFGLGEASAKQLAAAGAIVLIVARTQDKLDAVAAEIKAAGGIVHAYACDLSDIPQVEALIATVLAEHGHVDVLVNNAGKSIRRSVTLSFDRFKDYERTNAINYLGPVRLVLGLLPSMQARGQGHIVNVSTIGTRVPPGPRWAAYQASKGAFDIWLRSVAIEMESFGVTTSTIYMALIYTRMSAPTPIYRVMPGLMPEEAAHLIERAVVERPLEINPPWLRGSELASTVLRTPTRWIMRQMYLHSGDTASAKSSR
jgi:NAD(P)-dependent dehydrogenase (short-subunit alcohol dehydrogenase family)